MRWESLEKKCNKLLLCVTYEGRVIWEPLSETLDHHTLNVLTQQRKSSTETGDVADLMLACEGIARLVEGIPRFPCGNAGGMGFWGLHGPLLLFFLCFLVSAGGLVFLRGLRCCCCWCCTRRLPSPRRKLSCVECMGELWVLSHHDVIQREIKQRMINQ